MPWEKIDKFRMEILINNADLSFGRDQDCWLMMAFIQAGYTEQELVRLNRVMIHKQVLFLSDALCARGKSLDGIHLVKRQTGQKWSRLIFPLEQPPSRDFMLWRDAPRQVAPRGRVQNSLGKLLPQGHKIWEWRY